MGEVGRAHFPEAQQLLRRKALLKKHARWAWAFSGDVLGSVGCHSSPASARIAYLSAQP
jgi:hypothetical protein